MEKLQKLFPKIHKDLATYIKKELSKVDTLNFDMEPTSTGFVLSDVEFPNDKYEVSNDDFYTFLYNSEFLQSEEEYDYFISRVGEDTEIQEKIEEFFHTEEATEEFCNAISEGSYESCFKAVYSLSKAAKPTESPFPSHDVYEAVQRDFDVMGETPYIYG